MRNAEAEHSNDRDHERRLDGNDRGENGPRHPDGAPQDREENPQGEDDDRIDRHHRREQSQVSDRRQHHVRADVLNLLAIESNEATGPAATLLIGLTGPL